MSKVTYLSHINGRIDHDKGVIRGVSVITEGDARGHDLKIDSETVKQLLSACEGCNSGKVKTKLNHKSGIESVFGYLSDFRIQGPKLLADLTLLKKHKDYDQTLEQIQQMPESIGLSVAFTGKPQVASDGRKLARAERIVSVDLVPEPAANPTGLFSEPMIDEEVDTLEKSEMEPIQEVLEQIKALNSRLDAQEQSINDRFGQIEGFLGGGDDDGDITEEEIAEAVEALREQGYGDDEIEQIISAEIDSFYGDEEGGDGEYEPQGQDADDPGHPSYAGKDRVEDIGEAAAAAEPAGVGGGDGGGGEFSKIEQMVTSLENKLKAKEEAEKQAELNSAFQAVRDQIVELSARNDELEAQLEAAGEALRTGAYPVGANGAAQDITLSEGDFEDVVRTHIREGKSKGEAIALAAQENKQEHFEWLQRNGVLPEGASLHSLSQ